MLRASRLIAFTSSIVSPSLIVVTGTPGCQAETVPIIKLTRMSAIVTVLNTLAIFDLLITVNIYTLLWCLMSMSSIGVLIDGLFCRSIGFFPC